MKRMKNRSVCNYFSLEKGFSVVMAYQVLMVLCYSHPVFHRCNWKTEAGVHSEQRCGGQVDHLLASRGPQGQHFGLPCGGGGRGLWEPHVCLLGDGLWGKAAWAETICNGCFFHIKCSVYKYILCQGKLLSANYIKRCHVGLVISDVTRGVSHLLFNEQKINELMKWWVSHVSSLTSTWRE